MKSSHVKKIGLGLFVAVAAFAGAASAVPRHHEYVIYYSDDTHTTAVGSYTSTCSGRFYQQGVVTPYAEVIIDQECRITSPEPWGSFPY
ncbi:DUF6289 family protein [Brevundimonas sp. SH203]|uniref:DUF6289 family protein n=1 Tax=Brevundimonas sp. SH203 TaxID=345167 RepID=UPI00117854B7